MRGDHDGSPGPVTDPPRARTGRIVLAATPLGNPGDASARLVDALATADVVAAEDTRRVRRLAADLGVAIVGRRAVLLRRGRARAGGRARRAAAGRRLVLVVSDAGMPTVSDPGYRLVALAVERGIPRDGACPDRPRCWRRWPCRACRSTGSASRASCPRKGGRAGGQARRAGPRAPDDGVLRGAASPRGDARGPGRRTSAPDRPAAVCRELTKTYEEVVRGPLGELVAWAADGVRGEITVVVAGATAAERREAAGLTDESGWVAAVAGARDGRDRARGGDRGRRRVVPASRDARCTTLSSGPRTPDRRIGPWPTRRRSTSRRRSTTSTTPRTSATPTRRRPATSPTRWHRQRGEDVWFLTGVDEHGDEDAAGRRAQAA